MWVHESPQKTARQGVLDHRAQGSLLPLLLGSRETKFAYAPADAFGKNSGHPLPQDALCECTSDLEVRRQAHYEFDEFVVEIWNAGLHGERHGIAILVAEQRRNVVPKSELGEHIVKNLALVVHEH